MLAGPGEKPGHCLTKLKTLNQQIVKVRFIRSACGHGYGYIAGQELETNKAFGKELVELGLAIELEENTSNLPEDLPMRDVLIECGITDMAALEAIATQEGLVALNGIGKKSAENILKYLGK